MIRVASRLVFACCVLVQGPALANSADTDWLLEEIRSQLQSRTTMDTLGDCLDSTHCLSLRDDLEGRNLLSEQPYAAPFIAKQFPTLERPWFIDVARDSSETRSTPPDHSQCCDYTYRTTSLMQTVKSLEKVSLATFWERDGIELFPSEHPEFAVLPSASETLLGNPKGRSKRLSVRPPAFIN